MTAHFLSVHFSLGSPRIYFYIKMIALILLILLSSEATKAHAGVPVNYSAVEADIAKTLTSSKSFWPAGKSQLIY